MIVALWVIGFLACTVSLAARTTRVGVPALVVATVATTMAFTLMVTS